MMYKPTFILLCFQVSFDSSVGRAVDCSCSMSDIHRSLVQIRLEGVIKFLTLLSQQFLDSLVVRISACHVEGPGSIPGRGVNFCTISLIERKSVAPGEARPHNPGISLVLSIRTVR